MNKSIWYICQYAVPLKYGFGTRHFYLGHEMVKNGHKVAIISANYNYMMNNLPPDKEVYNYEEIDGIDVWWLRVNKYKSSDGIGRIMSWFIFMYRLFFFPVGRSFKPDIVIISSLSLIPILNGIYFKWKYKSKLIFEIRDIWPQTIIDLGNFSKVNPFIFLMKYIEKLGYKRADYIVATMPRADIHISNIIHKKFRFKCIPQGIDPNIVERSNFPIEPFDDKYIPKNKFLVGYAGAIGRSNGLETIINVAKKINSTNQEIHFVFLGDGPMKTQFQKDVSDLSNVTFIPKVNKLQVNSFLKECDVLYDSVKSVPIYKYGLSRNKWMDYMYSGRPLIVSYTGFLSLINEADCGTAVPSEDEDSLRMAIIKYSEKSKSELNSEGERGREYILSNRTFDKLVNEYESVFNEI